VYLQCDEIMCCNKLLNLHSEKKIEKKKFKIEVYRVACVNNDESGFKRHCFSKLFSKCLMG
jgi:hypothetical protein